MTNTILLTAILIGVAIFVLAAVIGVKLLRQFVTFIQQQSADAAEDALTSKANQILPISTGVLIETNQSAQITARPQRGDFTPHRIFISGAGTPGGAADWIINDIKIGNVSVLNQSGDIPGDMFSEKSLDSFVRMETARRGVDFVIVATYIGPNKKGCALYGAVIGNSRNLDRVETPIAIDVSAELMKIVKTNGVRLDASMREKSATTLRASSSSSSSDPMVQ